MAPPTTAANEPRQPGLTAQPRTTTGLTHMRVHVLGCSGAIARGCRTTSFLLDGDVLIDAGTGVGDLDLDQMAGIDHVLLTHSHLDHVASLPLMLDAVASRRIAQGKGPVQVHALPETIAALKAHVFNDIIWPDFAVIPHADAPLLRFVTFAVGQTLSVAGKSIEVLPAVHTVPAVGFAVQGDRGHWVFSGDTERNPGFWARVNQLPVAMLVIETAFSDRERHVAQRSLHLAPHVLADELDHIDTTRARFPIYITHTKPAETTLIMEEIRRFDQKPARAGDAPHDIRWLTAGDVFEV